MHANCICVVYCDKSEGYSGNNKTVRNQRPSFYIIYTLVYVSECTHISIHSTSFQPQIRLHIGDHYRNFLLTYHSPGCTEFPTFRTIISDKWHYCQSGILLQTGCHSRHPTNRIRVTFFTTDSTVSSSMVVI